MYISVSLNIIECSISREFDYLRDLKNIYILGTFYEHFLLHYKLIHFCSTIYKNKLKVHFKFFEITEIDKNVIKYKKKNTKTNQNRQKRQNKGFEIQHSET